MTDFVDSSNIKRFIVAIIESLKDEKLTGKILHDEILFYQNIKNQAFENEYYPVHNKEEFFKILNQLIKDAKSKYYFYILHLETHGDENGLILASGDFVTWKELFEYTRKLNQIYKGNLIIILALCKGITLISDIDPCDRAPFKIAVGTLKEISPTELLIGYTKFYEEYATSFNISKAIEAMNEECQSNKFIWIDDKYFFDNFCNPDRDPNYLNELANKKALEKIRKEPSLIGKKTEDVQNITKLEIIKLLESIKEHRKYFLFDDIAN